MIRFNSQAGISLIEVLVSSAIMATIAILAFGALDVSERSKTISEEKMRDLVQFDRGWVMLENDLRHALSYANGTEYGGPINAMDVRYGEEYFLIFLRGGKSNPLGFPRTELARVGYRLEDDVLWRDTWIDPLSTDIDFARQQIVLNNVEDVKVRALVHNAQSYKQGPWTEEWPSQQQQGRPDSLPLALEITIETKSRGEITRLFGLGVGL